MTLLSVVASLLLTSEPHWQTVLLAAAPRQLYADSGTLVVLSAAGTVFIVQDGHATSTIATSATSILGKTTDGLVLMSRSEEVLELTLGQQPKILRQFGVSESQRMLVGKHQVTPGIKTLWVEGINRKIDFGSPYSFTGMGDDMIAVVPWNGSRDLIKVKLSTGATLDSVRIQFGDLDIEDPFPYQSIAESGEDTVVVVAKARSPASKLGRLAIFQVNSKSGTVKFLSNLPGLRAVAEAGKLNAIRRAIAVDRLNNVIYYTDMRKLFCLKGAL